LIFHKVTDKNKLAPFFMAHGALPENLALYQHKLCVWLTAKQWNSALLMCLHGSERNLFNFTNNHQQQFATTDTAVKKVLVLCFYTQLESSVKVVNS